jgi:hypothetical protein
VLQEHCCLPRQPPLTAQHTAPTCLNDSQQCPLGHLAVPALAGGSLGGLRRLVLRDLADDAGAGAAQALQQLPATGDLKLCIGVDGRLGGVCAAAAVCAASVVGRRDGPCRRAEWVCGGATPPTREASRPAAWKSCWRAVSASVTAMQLAVGGSTLAICWCSPCAQPRTCGRLALSGQQEGGCQDDGQRQEGRGTHLACGRACSVALMKVGARWDGVGRRRRGCGALEAVTLAH